MTEQEAKRRWCPFSRVNSGETSYNRYNEIDPKFSGPIGTACLASGCMAWRWHSFERRDGFCGLAQVSND